MTRANLASPARGCPRCGETAALVGGEQPHEWSCPKCRGHYLSRAGVHELVVEELGVAEELLRELPSFETAGQALPCPCGRAETEACVLRGIHVDLCPDCGGLWLDAGELHRLSQGRRSAPASRKLRPGSRKQSAALHFESGPDALLFTGAFLGGSALLISLGVELHDSAYDTSAFATVGALLTLVCVPLLLFVGGTSLLVDPDRRVVLESRRVGRSVRQRVLCRAEDIACATVEGTYVPGYLESRSHSYERHPGYWNYSAVLLLRDGRTLDFSALEDRVDSEADEIAQQLAELLGVRYVPGTSEQPFSADARALGARGDSAGSARIKVFVVALFFAVLIAWWAHSQ